MRKPKLITLTERFSLYFQRVPMGPILEVRRLLLDHAIDIPVRSLAAHQLAGGDVREVGSGLVEARLRKVQLDFRRACAIDLVRDREDAMQRPVNLVRQAAEAQEVFFGPKGPLEITKPGRFTWRPRLRAQLRLNLDCYVGGALRDLIEIRLQLALRSIYDAAYDRVSADQALAAWLRDHERVMALAEGTRFRIAALERVL